MNQRNFAYLIVSLGSLWHLVGAAREPVALGSNAMAAGNPMRPQFTLTAVQNSQLPDIHPDVLEDTYLSTVSLIPANSTIH